LFGGGEIFEVDLVIEMVLKFRGIDALYLFNIGDIMIEGVIEILIEE
jgi:hypothetical protein